MNSSLITADGTTHVKILMVALLASMFVMWVALAAHAAATKSFSGDARIERSTSRLGAPRVVPG